MDICENRGNGSEEKRDDGGENVRKLMKTELRAILAGRAELRKKLEY